MNTLNYLKKENFELHMPVWSMNMRSSMDQFQKLQDSWGNTYDT